MRHRSAEKPTSAARHPGLPCRGRRRWLALLVVGCAWQLIAGRATAEDAGLPAAFDAGATDEYAPTSDFGGGSFYSQDLGTMLRFRYNTQSYGQDQDGNLDIGTMQVVGCGDSIGFFDGQVSLNDAQGVGFNLGIGYRYLDYVPFALEPERITGVSLWADGTHTEAGNFFPQVGVSYESLGDMWDFRANGYIPLGKRTKIGAFEKTGVTGFFQNSISELTTAVTDTAFTVGEFEVARRLGAERDAWLFAGGYSLTDEAVDATGYRIGMRGYFLPDLLVQFAVTDDHYFNTNATFSVIWFVGRTRTDYQPTCGLPDRMREPVMRNDYVALDHGLVDGGIPLLDPDGNEIRVVHVNSEAPAGGDGTFENPLNDTGDIFANSKSGDVVLLWSESEFMNQSGAVLRKNQRLLGEGDFMTFAVLTEDGPIALPETSPGASDLAKPIIMDAIGDAAVYLSDANEVANFTIDGGMNGIVAGPQGVGDPVLHDLMIMNTTDDGINLDDPFVRDNDGMPGTPERTVAFNITIDQVMFTDVGGDDIEINADTTEDLNDPDVTLNETIAISNTQSTGNMGRGLRVQNTHDGGTVSVSDFVNTDGAIGMQFLTIDGDVSVTAADVTGGSGFAFQAVTVDELSSFTVNDFAYDGGTGAGGFLFDGFNGMFTMSNSLLENGTAEGVSILGESSGAFTFNASNMFNSVDGTTFNVAGSGAGFTGTVTFLADIMNDTGLSVSISGMSGDPNDTTITFLGNITDNGGDAVTANDMGGVRVFDNDGGQALFAGDMALNTGTNDAIDIMGNAATTTIGFGGELDLDTTTGTGFSATGGGVLTATSNNNMIDTTAGLGLEIIGMEIGTPNGVSFAVVNAAGGSNGIVLEDNEGGPITVGTVGDDPGEGGLIEDTTDDAIVVTNSANVTISGVRVNNTNAVSAVRVEQSSTENMLVNLNDLELNDGDIGAEIVGGGTGNLSMTLNDTAINDSTVTGASFDNVDSGTIQANNVTIDGNNVNGTAGGVLITDSDATITFDSDSTIQEFGGTDFEVDGGEGAITYNGDIVNSSSENPGDTSGLSVHIHDMTGGSVTMTGSVDSTNEGVVVEDNEDTDINLLGSYMLATTTNDAVTVMGNTGTTNVTLNDVETTTTNGDGVVVTGNASTTSTAFTDVNIEATGTGAGFTATGGGDLSVAGSDNTISTMTGTGLTIDGMNIAGGATFESVSVDGATNGILLNEVTGSTVTVGDANNTAPDGGTLANTTGVAISITDVASTTLNGIEVQGSMMDAVQITKNAAANMAVTMNDMDLNSMDGGVSINGAAAAGTFNVTSNDGAIEADGTALEVQGRVTSVSSSDDITNSTGLSIHIHDVTAGTITHTGDVTDTGGEGVLVDMNTGGDINLLGDYTLNTAANDAMTITDNTGANVSIADFAITTTSGAGFTATGGGDLTVIGTDNTIETTTGTGLEIDGMNIDGQATFESVSVDGATNGILLTDVTGDSIRVGDTGNSAGQGGTIANATDAGISITDVENVFINGVTVDNANTSSGTNAVDVTYTGAADMNVSLNDVTVMNQAMNGVEADGSAGTGTFTVSISDLDVTADGDGLNVHDGVTLQATGSSTIESDTGVGLTISDATVAPAGASFQSVDVTNGATNGIALTRVVGGTVRVGSAAGAADSGGTLTTTGDAIVVVDVESVELNNVKIASAGGAGVMLMHTSAATTTMDVTMDTLNIDSTTGTGVGVTADNDAHSFALRLIDSDLEENVDMNVTGAGQFGLLVEDTDITVGGAAIAFDLQFSDDATDGDVTIRDNNNFTADTGVALFIDSFDPTAKDIKILVEDSNFVSNTAGTAAADIESRGNTLMQLTVQGNTFDSSAASDDLYILSNGTNTARMRLNLGGDDSADFNSPNGTGTMLVEQMGTSVFSIFERDDTLNDLRNNGTVNDSGTIGDLATPPLLPTVP